MVNYAEGGMEAEANVVTEYSEDLIHNKARLRGKFGSSGSDKNQCYKPSFSKRGIENKKLMILD